MLEGGCIGNNRASLCYLIANTRNCVPFMSKNCSTERIFVSVCRCYKGLKCVLPGMIPSVVFCTTVFVICSDIYPQDAIV